VSDLDRDALEAFLHAGCLEAIGKYREVQDPADPAVCFAIDAAPYYGTFFPSFEIASGARAEMEARAAQVAADRGWTRDPAPEAWKTAFEHARHQSLRLVPEEVGDWTHHMIHELRWDVAALTGSPRYQELNQDGTVDGWIEGQCRGILTRVCDRLVDERAFDAIATGRPFGVGYCYEGEPMLVCRALF
jgi:hypothetical protein